MFASILIANRGEIACRVMRTARRLGIRTIAVYSTADAGALHVRTADEAWCIGPPGARESYLNVDRILSVARDAGAAAIHPGYGFLSESAHFAQACEAAGIRFIGPPAAAIRAMGSKSAAKSLLEAAGVPLTPGYHGSEQGAAFLADQADRIGYPVLIKASAGGGGKGMRRVDHARDFGAALASCRREAAAAFGSDHVLLEKYILQPRHIEVQIFADTQGNAVHLFERDCSVQRRHQKVIEEAPAPGMSPARRAAMGAAAVQVARAVAYVGAGTVEFIAPRAALDGAAAMAADQPFFFMEMNTRLQVEHPVTEMITGQDLVEWQIRVAAGEPLPCRQEDLRIHGHAIEARLYAEDADHGFAPAIGTLVHFGTPAPSVHVRLDAGVEAGDAITPHYDPMIAKLIAWDTDRAGARARLREALAQTRIVGVVNNVAFLSRLIDSPSFAGAVLDTDLIERDAAFLAMPAAPPPRAAWLLAALAQRAVESRADARAGTASAAWGGRDSWRVNLAGTRVLPLVWLGGAAPLGREMEVVVGPESVGLLLDGQTSDCRAIDWEPGAADASDGPGGAHPRGQSPELRIAARMAASGRLRAQIDGRSREATAIAAAGCWHVFLEARHDVFAVGGLAATAADSEAATGTGGVLAPMPGKVIALLATPGQHVERDAPLLIVEAMKMEHTLRAPRTGRVRAFRVAVGDQVAMGEPLIDVDDAVADPMVNPAADPAAGTAVNSAANAAAYPAGRGAADSTADPA
jgi:3-methylcrotonyl-CoA carboxylase alpha subunit